MKILVDWQKCTGIGICEALSPDTFEVGDDGKLQLINGEVIPEGLEAEIDSAIAGCPTAALSKQAS
ncbi:ferredoxin [Gordonia westfalica]|uniref:Ferredoxin n=2 Tax=Gordonia TaxID=2053 RepID=A0A1H2KXC0_9ACTN|nr:MULTISPECIES: ferredoxin [Gordonia]MDS1113382.1 ferredoxin [Gordonia westfalica]GAA13025.1 putative 3Fe-4S ferredoxin [Gordonia alkanivorans NBRC 16433]SDU73134.1 ferredoxin [Gordonia westfalica]